MKRLIAVLFALCLFAPTMTWGNPGVVPDKVAIEAATPPADRIKAEPEAPAAAAEPAKTDEAAPAADPEKVTPEDVKEIIEDVSFLIQAAKDGNWPLFFGILLTLLVFVLDKLIKIRKKVSEKALPWVAVALGMAAAIGAALASGLAWSTALIQGFTTGAAAVGFWELVLKHILKPKAAPEEATEAAPEA